MTNDEEMTKPKTALTSDLLRHSILIRHSPFELRRVYGNVPGKERAARLRGFVISFTSYTPALRVTPAAASLLPPRSTANPRA